ncbi:Uncharacterized protein QTN25_009693 [Entamoeba marina]
MSGKKIPYCDFKNYQVIQQAVMLAYLNQFADIELKKKKKSVTNIYQFMQVVSISFSNGDNINFSDLISSKCIEMMKEEIEMGISETTAMRRFHKNRIVHSLHLLMDILSELGFFFNTYITNGKNGVVRAETIRSMFYDDKLLKKDDIVTIGKRIFKCLDEQFEEKKVFTLKKNTLLRTALVDTNCQGGNCIDLCI